MSQADGQGRYPEAIVAYRTTVRHLDQALSVMDPGAQGPIATRRADYDKRASELEEAQALSLSLNAIPVCCFCD